MDKYRKAKEFFDLLIPVASFGRALIFYAKIFALSA